MAVLMGASMFFFIHHENYLPAEYHFKKHLDFFLFAYLHIAFRGQYYRHLIFRKRGKLNLFERILILGTASVALLPFLDFELAVELVFYTPIPMIGSIIITYYNKFYLDLVTNTVYLIALSLVLSWGLGFHSHTEVGLYSLTIGVIIELLVLFFGISKISYKFKLDSIEAELEGHRLRQNLQLASTIQNKLMRIEHRPQNLAVHYEAAEHVGGDWYAYLEDKFDGIEYLFLGDITGHGVKSAYITAQITGCCSVIQNHFLQENHKVDDILQDSAQLFNRIFLEYNSSLKLGMSFCAVAIDKSKDVIKLLNCGHPAILKMSRGRPAALVSRGPLIGVREDFDAEVTEFSIKDGDQIMLYTDGLLENVGEAGKPISYRNLTKIIDYHLSPTENLNAIKGLMSKTWGDTKIEDDVSVLIYKYTA